MESEYASPAMDQDSHNKGSQSITSSFHTLMAGMISYLLVVFSIFIYVHTFLFLSDIQAPLHDDIMVKDNRAMHVDSDIGKTKKRGKKDNT